jgi:predicted lipase
MSEKKILLEKFLRYCELSEIAGRKEYVPGCPDIKIHDAEYKVLYRFSRQDRCEGNILQKVGQENRIVVSFKGSVEIVDWFHDAQAWQTPWPWNAQYRKAGAWVHNGFAAYYSEVRLELSYKLSEICRAIRAAGLRPDVTICGHSMGGALSTECALDYCGIFGDILDLSCYTFGSPKVLNRQAAQLLNDKLKYIFRITNNKDVVPNIPNINYQHVGDLFHFNELYSWDSKDYWIFPLFASVPDHLVENYKQVIGIADAIAI